MELEKWRGGSGSERSGGAHRDRRQHAGRAKLENLVPISTPARLRATATRNLPLPRAPRERGHVDLPGARLVGGICHPFSVRRDHAVDLIPGPRLKWAVGSV